MAEHGTFSSPGIHYYPSLRKVYMHLELLPLQYCLLKVYLPCFQRGMYRIGPIEQSVVMKARLNLIYFIFFVSY